jgi:adenylylsulfate kinase
MGAMSIERKKILVMGLPGAGKTTLARDMAPKLGAVLFNADDVRKNLNKDLGFSLEDRIEQARRMGWLCDRVAEAGHFVIADFICPTPETRAAFGEAFVIWVDRIQSGRFADTNRLFVPPERHDIRVTATGSCDAWGDLVVSELTGGALAPSAQSLAAGFGQRLSR